MSLTTLPIETTPHASLRPILWLDRDLNDANEAGIVYDEHGANPVGSHALKRGEDDVIAAHGDDAMGFLGQASLDVGHGGLLSTG